MKTHLITGIVIQSEKNVFSSGKFSWRKDLTDYI